MDNPFGDGADFFEAIPFEEPASTLGDASPFALPMENVSLSDGPVDLGHNEGQALTEELTSSDSAPLSVSGAFTDVTLSDSSPALSGSLDGFGLVSLNESTGSAADDASEAISDALEDVALSTEPTGPDLLGEQASAAGAMAAASDMQPSDGAQALFGSDDSVAAGANKSGVEVQDLFGGGGGGEEASGTIEVPDLFGGSNESGSTGSAPSVSEIPDSLFDSPSLPSGADFFESISAGAASPAHQRHQSTSASFYSPAHSEPDAPFQQQHHRTSSAPLTNPFGDPFASGDAGGAFFDQFAASDPSPAQPSGNSPPPFGVPSQEPQGATAPSSPFGYAPPGSSVDAASFGYMPPSDSYSSRETYAPASPFGGGTSSGFDAIDLGGGGAGDASSYAHQPFQTFSPSSSFSPSGVSDEDAPDTLSMMQGRCCFASFGFGGKLVVFRASSMGGSAPITVAPIQSIIADSPYFASLKNFPGPLHKQSQSAVAALAEQRSVPKDGASRKRRDACLLWQLLALLVRSGGYWSDESVEAVLHAIAGHHQHSDRPAASAAHAGPSAGPSLREDAGDGSAMSYERRAQLVAEIETLLVQGSKSEALEVAAAAGLWPHAMLIASQLSSIKFAETARRFSAAVCRDGSVLQSLYQEMAERSSRIFVGAPLGGSVQGPAVDVGSPENWAQMLYEHLSKHVKKLAAQHGSANTLAAAAPPFGDAVWQKLLLPEAAHVCYLLGSTNLGYLDQQQTRVVLLGADHKTAARHSFSFGSGGLEEAIQRSEVYEYARTLTNVQFTMPALQVWKFVYAQLLADVGLLEPARAYLDAVESVTARRKDAIRNRRFLAEVQQFRARLDGEKGDSLLAESARVLGGLFSSLVSSAPSTPSAPAPSRSPSLSASTPGTGETSTAQRSFAAHGDSDPQQYGMYSSDPTPFARDGYAAPVQAASHFTAAPQAPATSPPSTSAFSSPFGYAPGNAAAASGASPPSAALSNPFGHAMAHSPVHRDAAESAPDAFTYSPSSFEPQPYGSDQPMYGSDQQSGAAEAMGRDEGRSGEVQKPMPMHESGMGAGSGSGADRPRGFGRDEPSDDVYGSAPSEQREHHAASEPVLQKKSMFPGDEDEDAAPAPAAKQEKRAAQDGSGWGIGSIFSSMTSMFRSGTQAKLGLDNEYVFHEKYKVYAPANATDEELQAMVAKKSAPPPSAAEVGLPAISSSPNLTQSMDGFSSPAPSSQLGRAPLSQSTTGVPQSSAIAAMMAPPPRRRGGRRYVDVLKSGDDAPSSPVAAPSMPFMSPHARSVSTPTMFTPTPAVFTPQGSAGDEDDAQPRFSLLMDLPPEEPDQGSGFAADQQPGVPLQAPPPQ